MGRTQVAVRVVVVFLVAYAGLMAVRGPHHPDQVYPVARWDLFSRVPPSERTSYSIRFVEVDGRVLDEPVYFEKADAFVGNTASPTAYQLLQDLGRAAEREQPLRMAGYLDLLTTSHLQTIGSARIEVVKRRFDIVERLECDCFLQEDVLAELEVGDP